MTPSPAQDSDKNSVLRFCQNTFSWGDYIKDVWDKWMDEGNLYVIRDGNSAVALCHAILNPKRSWLWIEGIRVHPKFRRMCLASKLIKHCESLASTSAKSRMLIDTSNRASIKMATKLDYTIQETWNFFTLTAARSVTTAQFASIKDWPKIKKKYYVRSWRWIPLDKELFTQLICNKQVICCGDAIATIIESDHFEDTIIVTLYGNNFEDQIQVIKFVQDFAHQQKIHRIQLLTTSKINNMQERLTFHLFVKDIVQTSDKSNSITN